MRRADRAHMQEPYKCSFCIYNDIRREARQEGRKLTIRPGPGRSGVLVFSHPPDVHIPMDVSYTNEEYSEYLKCWLHAVGDHCTC